MIKKFGIPIISYIGAAFVLATSMFLYETLGNNTHTITASLRNDTLYINDATYPHCVSKVEDLPIYMVMATLTTKEGNDAAVRGTAFYIGNGTWLTAAHVTEDSPRNLRIELPTGVIPATLETYNEEKDIAVLRTEEVDLMPIEYTMVAPTFQQRVWNIGYPGWALRQRVVSSGEVIGDNDHLFYSTAMVMGGMSGGPTISCYGDVPKANGVISLYSQIELSSSEVVTDQGEVYLEVKYINSGESFSSELKSIEEKI